MPLLYYITYMKRFICVAIATLALCSCNPSTPTPVVDSFVTISLDANGGYISKDKVTVKQGTLYSEGLFPTPSKDGYIFSYWSRPNDELIPLESTYTLDYDVTIKAQYAKAIKVTFNTDGGSSLDASYVAEGDLYKASLFKTPTKDGYTFTHWVFDDGEDTPIPDIYEFKTDITLKAKYTEQAKPVKTDDEKYIEAMNIQQLDKDVKYLFTATCNDVDYTIAEKYFNTSSSNKYYSTLGKAGCSSVYSNGFAGHNFDLNYSTLPEFIVKTTGIKDSRYASIGVAYDYELSTSNVNTTKDMAGHKVLPFLTFDGVNEKGLFICANEVPVVKSDPTIVRVEHTDKSKPKMNTLNTVRYLLDNASSVSDAKDKMKERDFFTPTYINEFHYLIADSTGASAVIEFKSKNDGSGLSDIVFYELGSSSYEGIMTNFTFNGYTGDASTYTKSDSSLSLHAEGVERYNILYKKLITDKFEIKSTDNMLDLLKSVYYTYTYKYQPTDTANFWYSEFHYNSLTKNSTTTPSNYTSLLNGYLQYYNNKTRVNYSWGGFFMSRHSVAYDLKNKELKIIFEENTTMIYPFSLNN